MDSGVDTTQRIVISVSVFLAIVIVAIIGYSLYVKAKRAEGQLSNRLELEQQTQRKAQQACISLTGEAKNTSNFTFDGLVQKKDDSVATPTDFGIVNEESPVDIPEETTAVDEEEPVPPEEEPIVEPPPKKVVAKKPVVVDEDRPLTAEEIRAIRQLPIDNSPSGNLQTTLEEESQGQYKAQY
jgi:cbb3-type cytochrome oxidase subunit 3